MVKPLWKFAWWFRIKLTIQLPYDLAIPVWGIYPREVKTRIHKRITQMFIAAYLFLILPGNNPNAHHQDTWICCIRTKKYH